MEGHGVERDAIVAAVSPVHVGEEGDAAREEGEEHHAAVVLVQPTLLETQLVDETSDSDSFFFYTGQYSR